MSDGYGSAAGGPEPPPTRRPRARLVVTGDEVLLGRVQERNAAFLAGTLHTCGVEVCETRIVADGAAGIAAAVREAAQAGIDLVVTSGGLGPTHDDRTMAAVADALGLGIGVDPEALALVDAAQRRRALVGSGPAARKQAEMPAGARVLPPVGTAPGAMVAAGGTIVVVLPGPPWELVGMWDAAVAMEPLRGLLAGAPARRLRTLRLAGTPESELMAVRAGLAPAAADALHGIYTRAGELEVVVDADAGDANALVGGLRSAFGLRLYSDDGRGVDELVAERLVSLGERLAVAESCTGGGLGALLTARPGSSVWFLGGVIAYDNTVKTELLGVAPEIIATHGAVSRECASAMADGVRRLLAADWGVAITGVAGPGGGSPGTPVGLVVIAVAGTEGTQAWEHRLPGDREGVRSRAAAAALHRLREALLSQS